MLEFPDPNALLPKMPVLKGVISQGLVRRVKQYLAQTKTGSVLHTCNLIGAFRRQLVCPDSPRIQTVFADGNMKRLNNLVVTKHSKLMF
jgi:hypothetical protein